MSNLTKPFIILIIAGVFLSTGLFSLAQEEISAEVIEAINLDEDIKSEDLGISEPNVLPDNPFYFLKEWGRNIQSFFTFNLVKKAELKEKFASEKLIEVKKLIEKEKEPEVIKKGLENYQKEIERIKTAGDKIKVKAEESPEVSSFLDKFTKHQTLHYRILQKLETQVPSQVFEKIEEVRERHLERFGEVMTKLEEIPKISERLEKNLKEVKGSEFKEFKNLEILEGLEEKAPEAAKEAVRKVQENSLIRLKTNLEQMSSEELDKFKEYIEKSSGVKEEQMEILENLRMETPKLEEMLIQSRERVIEQVREKMQERECPEIEKPASDFCKEGRIVVEKDDKGCVISFKCITLGETGIIEKPEPEKPKPVCIALWNPVCGKDGKTYSNACFAKMAGVEIDYKGVCKEQLQLRKSQP